MTGSPLGGRSHRGLTPPGSQQLYCLPADSPKSVCNTGTCWNLPGKYRTSQNLGFKSVSEIKKEERYFQFTHSFNLGGGKITTSCQKTPPQKNVLTTFSAVAPCKTVGLRSKWDKLNKKNPFQFRLTDKTKLAAFLL